MNIKAEEISKIIRDQIGSYAVDVDVAEVGTIVSIGDGIRQCPNSLLEQLVYPAIRQRLARTDEVMELEMQLLGGKQTSPPRFGIWISGEQHQRGEVITGDSGGAVLVNGLRPIAQPQRQLIFTLRDAYR